MPLCPAAGLQTGMGHLPKVQETLQQSAGIPRTCSKCGQMVAGTLDRCPHDGTPFLSAEAVARVGTRVGDYEIRGVVGEGGTGVVYRGRHVASDRRVAIKILREHCARKKGAVEQFIGEAGATSHPNVIDVTDLGTTPDGTVFLAMEYLEGESLRDRLLRVQRLPLFEAINIVRQLARGLGAAHEAGIVHGGLKPAHVFLCRREGRRRIVRRSRAKGMRLAVEPEGSFDLVKLLDFGTARFIDPGSGDAGVVWGAPHYLSPEQAQGRPADQRSDIYSLGAVFYEMVTGTVLFSDESLPGILRGHVAGEVIAPSRRTPEAGIHARIDALILRCLKKNPSLRYANTSELCEELDACVADCAFLRDAYRLPGIMESGIDLSEASPRARHEPARSAEGPTAAPVAGKPVVALVAQKTAVASVVATPAAAPVLQKPGAAPVRAKPPAIPIAAKLTAARSAGKPATARAAQAPAEAPLAGSPRATSIPPPAAEDSPAAISARVADQPRRRTREHPPAIISEVEELSDWSDLESAFRSGQPGLASSRRRQLIAVAGILLLGGAGIAVWAVRGGSASRATKPSVASRAAPAVAPEPSPPPLAAAPVAAPAVVPAPSPSPLVAAPVAAPAVAPAPSPPPLVAALVAAPAAPAETASVAALPRPEPAAPAEADDATAHDPGQLASSRTRPAQASRARRTTSVVPVPPEIARAPAAKPGLTVPSTAAAAPEPNPPAPADADDLMRGAQQAWMGGLYAAAIRKARAALKADPTHARATQAYEIIAVCSCAIGDADAAREAASHLSETRREMVKAMCMKNGVTVE